MKYKAQSDANGKVVLMLPLKNRYMVNFAFQHDAAILDLSRMKGFATLNQSVNYVPDPRLENIESFIPRVSDLIAIDVNEFVTAQYPSSTNDVDLFLKWGNRFNASSKEAVLEVGFKVNAKDKKAQIPKNLVLVIDVSGSMGNDNRLELLKNTPRTSGSNCFEVRIKYSSSGTEKHMNPLTIEIRSVWLTTPASMGMTNTAAPRILFAMVWSMTILLYLIHATTELPT